jgi:hypothetical protein
MGLYLSIHNVSIKMMTGFDDFGDDDLTSINVESGGQDLWPIHKAKPVEYALNASIMRNRLNASMCRN